MDPASDGQVGRIDSHLLKHGIPDLSGIGMENVLGARIGGEPRPLRHFLLELTGPPPGIAEDQLERVAPILNKVTEALLTPTDIQIGEEVSPFLDLIIGVEEPADLGIDRSSPKDRVVGDVGVTGKAMIACKGSKVQGGRIIDDEAQGPLCAVVQDQDDAPCKVRIT